MKGLNRYEFRWTTCLPMGGPQIRNWACDRVDFITAPSMRAARKIFRAQREAEAALSGTTGPLMPPDLQVRLGFSIGCFY